MLEVIFEILSNNIQTKLVINNDEIETDKFILYIHHYPTFH